jgi:hypothetical protein
MAASVRFAAQPQAPTAAGAAAATPKFQPVPGAIVNGLSGLINATAGLKDYRSVRRAMVFRTALAESLKPGLDLTKPITVEPSNYLMLCSMRGDYAVLNVQTSYITSLTSALDQLATPSN